LQRPTLPKSDSRVSDPPAYSLDMGQFLFYYQRPEPATWVYMSSFLVVGIYFMFHRFWSVRNLDILLLLLLTPGLMLIYESYRSVEAPVNQAMTTAPAVTKSPFQLSSNKAPQQFVRTDQVADDAAPLQHASGWSVKSIRRFGYIWLLSVCGLWLIRLLIDTTFFRRPLLEPNLTKGGLIFIGISLFAFLLVNVLNSPTAAKKATQVNLGPGFDPLKALPDIATTQPQTASTAEAESTAIHFGSNDAARRMKQEKLASVSRILLMISNVVLVLGIVGISYWHFSDLKTGVGAAVLYLLLPYTAQMIGRIEHAIPGSLIVLAVLLYRRPLLSGAALGLAGGLVFYPFFLLPLWLSYYWQRGQRRFIGGVAISLIGLVIALACIYQRDSFVQLRQMFGTIDFATENLDGIWGLGLHPYVRIPVIAVFVVLAFSFAFWPAQKSLATLINCSAAVMVASQFCYAFGGGLLMAWYLPLILLAVFRPNLDDLVASQAVRKFQLYRRKEPPKQLSEAGAEA
jgi:hypothetical protein